MDSKGMVKGIRDFLLRFIISAGLLWFLFRQMPTGRLSELLSGASLGYIFLAFVPFMIIHVILIIRWRIIIHALGLDLPWLLTARYFFLGLFGNLFLPSAIGGDIIRTAGLCLNRSDRPKIVASVLIERLAGFASMVVVATLAYCIGYRFVSHIVFIAIVAMATVLLGLGSVLFHEGLYRFFCHVFVFFPKFRNAVIQMHYDIALLKHKKIAIVRAVGISCLSQACLALVFFWLTRGLGYNVSLLYFMIFTPMACVAASFPSIGGLGFREAGLEYLLIGVGVAEGVGVSIGLLSFVFMALVGVFGYVFFLVTGKERSIEVSQEG